MIGSLLMAALLSQAPADMEKFDCDKQCDDIRKMCFFGCEQETKHAAKSGEAAPMDCNTMCEAPIERCKQMCAQYKQNKPRMKNIRSSDIEAAESETHEHEE